MKALAVVILSVVDGCTWTKNNRARPSEPLDAVSCAHNQYRVVFHPSRRPARRRGLPATRMVGDSSVDDRSRRSPPRAFIVLSHQEHDGAPRWGCCRVSCSTNVSDCAEILRVRDHDSGVGAYAHRSLYRLCELQLDASHRAMGVLDFEHWKLSSIAWRTTDYIKGSWPSDSHDHHPSKGCRRFVFERAGQSFVEVLRTGDRDECNWEKLRGGWSVPSDHPDGGFDKSHSPVFKWKAPACEAELSATSWTPSRQTDMCFLGDSHISKMSKIGALVKTAPARARAVFSVEWYYPIDDEQFGVPHWNANKTSEKS